MKLLTYIWRNVTRNKLRSLLTILSIGFSLALMTVLYGYMVMQDAWALEASRHHRIVVMNIQGFSGRVPIAYVDRVRKIDGIVAAIPYSWFGGNYKDEQMPFAQFGTDAAQAFDVMSEFSIVPEQLAAWREDRQGCVVDRRLAAKRNWKIGERIPLKGTFYPVELDLVLRGTYDTPQNTDSLWFHLDYMDEKLKQLSSEAQGNAGTIFAKTTDGDVMARVAADIDSRFSSSDNPTRTQSEAAFAKMFSDMLGNIQAYIRNIGLAVVFSLSLVAANAMAMSMRERITEVAVLKAIGFSRGRVMTMVLGEACAIAAFGGLLGIGMGCVFLELIHRVSSQFFPLSITEMAGFWLVYMALVAMGIGFVSGIVPATRAASLSVVDGLRRVV